VMSRQTQAGAQLTVHVHPCTCSPSGMFDCRLKEPTR
jgi:hypothetical protein